MRDGGLNTFACRRLTAIDLAPYRELMGVFGEAFDDRQTYAGAPPGDAYATGLLSQPHFIAVAAFADGAVVGGLTAYLLDKFEQERREIYIYDLAVSEAHRRCGIATALIIELRHIAADLDVYVIFVQADLTDAPAIALYNSLGTQETAHHFDISVVPRSR